MTGIAAIMAGMASSAAAGDDLSDLFGGGELGDWWRFDNVNTDQTSVGGAITSATGTVNGLTLARAGGGSVTLEQPSGNYAMQTSGASGARMSYTFGSTLSQPGTIILCVGSSSLQDPATLCTGSSTTSRWQISIDSSDNLIGFAGNSLDSTLNNPLGTALFTFEFNSTSSVIRKDGTQIATGNMGTQGTNQLTIGALWDGTSAYVMNVYSILIINRLLTTGVGGERDRAERLLGGHAGLSW